MLLLLSTAALADDEEISDPPNSLKAGARALLLDIKPEPSSSATLSVGGALKLHSGDGTGTRVGFLVDWLRRDEDLARSIVEPPEDPVDQNGTLEYRSWSIGVDVMHFWYPVRGGLVNLYWAVGPTASYRKTEADEERENPGADDYSQDYWNTQDSWTFGAKGLLGVEWFAVERVSLYAEYRAWVAYRTANGERTTQYTYAGESQTITETIDIRGWSADANAVLVGVAAYF
jgi:hypothetical protein